MDLGRKNRIEPRKNLNHAVNMWSRKRLLIFRNIRVLVYSCKQDIWFDLDKMKHFKFRIFIERRVVFVEYNISFFVAIINPSRVLFLVISDKKRRDWITWHSGRSQKITASFITSGALSTWASSKENSKRAIRVRLHRWMFQSQPTIKHVLQE